MIGTNFMDEIDCGNFFDNMDDLLEFPNDDVGIVGNGNKLRAIGDYCDAFSNSIWDDAPADNNSPDTLVGVDDAVFSGNNNTSAADLSAELAVPYEDIVQLEWLSTFVEDSFSADGMTMKKDNRSSSSSNSQFRTSSPVSVLESSSSSTNTNTNVGTIPITHEKRARSKRPRPPTFTPKPYMHLMISSPNSSPPLFVRNSSYEPNLPLKRAKKEKSFSSRGGGGGAVDGEPRKKTKIRILPPCPNAAEQPMRNQNSNPNSLQQGPVRKCLHCQITKTPQWRAGPMGPKTLCNACGVRYKSGRLYPEYRPAASPTFVPTLHSNSHKKVLEMRTKGTGGEAVFETGNDDGDKSVTANAAEDVPAAFAPAAAAAGFENYQTELIPKSDLLPDYV